MLRLPQRPTRLVVPTLSTRIGGCWASPRSVGAHRLQHETRSSGKKVRTSSMAATVEGTAGAPKENAATVDGTFPIDEEGRVLLKELDFEGTRDFLASIGVDEKRTVHVWRWLYRHRIKDWEQAQGTPYALNSELRRKMREKTSLSGGLELIDVLEAADGTRKLLLKATDGAAKGLTIQTVVIPMFKGATNARYTVCVSSQCGCGMGCAMCLTGKMGLLASLSRSQIIEQVVQARNVLAEAGDKTPLSHVVYMGQGEPMHNVDSVIGSLKTISHQEGLGIRRDAIQVSTVGLVPEMKRFMQETQGRHLLAVSLHASSDEKRSKIIPVNKRHSISELVSFLEEVFPPNQKKTFCVIEYTLLHGVNDSEDDARSLAKLLQNVRCIVNLIVFNPFEGTDFVASPEDVTQRFQNTLREFGMICSVRESKGGDEMAACGQLGTSRKPQI